MITAIPSSANNSAHSRAFFIPSAPFSIWEGDTFLWSSDEKYMRRYASAKGKTMAKADFLIDDKTYTVACEEGQDTYASFLANTIGSAVSGEKNKEATSLLAFYEICKEFFTKELTSRFSFSSSSIPLWMALENELSFVFSLFLTAYPILCKDPMAAIDVRFEHRDDSIDVTLTPHCEIDLDNDILNGDFISTLLGVTLKNADISFCEKSVGGTKSICLSSKCVTAVTSTNLFNSATSTEISYLFTAILAFCVPDREFAE